MDKHVENSRNIIECSLSFSYEGQSKPSISIEDAYIAKGEFIVLCGASGCGKSTLLRCFSHMIPEFYEGIFDGYVLIEGENISHKSIGEVGEKVSFVFQDPRSQFFTLDSMTEVAFALENFGWAREKIRRRVDAAFEKFGLEHLKNREVFKLSSGERQLIAILAAWAMDTPIILLDEPTANLDYQTIIKLRGMLEDLKKDGKTIIVSEHRLYYLKNLADCYWHIDAGTVHNRYSRQEFSAFSRAQFINLGLRLNDLEKLELTVEKVIPAESEADGLQVRNLAFQYVKGTPILTDISLEANVGEVFCFIGQNGCGKTSLAKCLAGLLPAQAGEIKLAGEVLSPQKLREKSIFIMQEAEFQFFSNSVIGELEYGHKKVEVEERIKSLLEEFDMWDLRYRHPFSLSGGQMQKLTLMMAFLSKKKIIILDEPTSSLDKKSLDSCVSLIRKMQKDKIVFLISHDLELLASVANRLIQIEDGCIKASKKLEGKEDLETLRSCFGEGDISSLEETGMEEPKRHDIPLDPRVNLLYFLVSVIAVAVADPGFIASLGISLLVLALANRRYRSFWISGAILGTIYTSVHIYPSELTIFTANFLPRFVLIAILFPIILGGEGAANILAALRKLKVPEKIIMICSVSFRFFPVLRHDLTLMGQSIQSRENEEQRSWLKRLFEKVEALIISMVFRVIRIAEALSASAESRGISLRRKRSSLIALKMGIKEYGMMLLLATAITVGIVC
ncbi:MAG: ATP-binding cassette domain-containing protein [Eubacteriales bacterium]|nr:ATP-binding cassette domain-containing protein [Eubacteriales bacterium]